METHVHKRHKILHISSRRSFYFKTQVPVVLANSSKGCYTR